MEPVRAPLPPRQLPLDLSQPPRQRRGQPGGGKRDAAAAQEAELMAAMGFGSFKKRRR